MAQPVQALAAWTEVLVAMAGMLRSDALLPNSRTRTRLRPTALPPMGKMGTPAFLRLVAPEVPVETDGRAFQGFPTAAMERPAGTVDQWRELQVNRDQMEAAVVVPLDWREMVASADVAEAQQEVLAAVVVMAATRTGTGSSGTWEVVAIRAKEETAAMRGEEPAVAVAMAVTGTQLGTEPPAAGLPM